MTLHSRNTGTRSSFSSSTSSWNGNRLQTSGREEARNGTGWPAPGDRCILVEAKANIPEFDSTPSAASSRSRVKIQQALDDTKKFLRAGKRADWTTCFYQYANRLAHLYLLRELNKLDAALVFVYFVGDTTVPGRKPVSREGWEAANDLALNHLAVRPHAPWMKQNVFDVFINVDDLRHISSP